MATWFLAVRNDNTVPDPMVADVVMPPDVEVWPFVSGEPVSGLENELLFRASSMDWDGEPDDVLQNAVGLPVFSSRLRDALQQAGITNIQYVPVRVVHSDGLPVEGYSVANVLDMLPSLNWDLSVTRKSTREPGNCASISKLVITPPNRNELHCFRLQEFRLYLLVSQHFKNVFEAGRFTGYSFAAVTTS